jgi:translocator protein
LGTWLSLLPFLAVVAAAAVSGAVFMPGEWYASLNKPGWTPPDWLFPPAWTVLYVMIAVAGWLIWSTNGAGLALVMWALNLVFNALWSWLMFGRHRIGLALADAMAMLITIVGFILLARSLNPTAALLFLPYLGWVIFATALNFEILQRNPSAA